MSNLRELDDGTIQKQCSKCQEWKRIPEGYSLAASCSDGFETHCRTCNNAEKRLAWANMPLDKKKKKMRKVAEANYRLGYANTHLE